MFGQPPSACPRAEGPLLSTTPQFLQLAKRLFLQNRQLPLLLAQILHHIRRSLGQKLTIPQLPLPAPDPLVQLLQFFPEPLALRRRINLALVNHVHIKPRRAPSSTHFGQ